MGDRVHETEVESSCTLTIGRQCQSVNCHGLGKSASEGSWYDAGVFQGKHSESGALEVGLVAGGDSGDGRHGVGTLEGEALAQALDFCGAVLRR